MAFDPVSSAAALAGDVAMMGIQDHFNRRSSDRAFNQQLQADATKYQRAVADLKAAGLNPVLAAGGAVGGGVGSSALGVSGQNVDLIESGLATGSAKATQALQAEQAGAAKEAAGASAAAARLADQQREVAATQIPVNSANAAKMAADAELSRQNTEKQRLQNEAYKQLTPKERLLYDTGQIGGVAAGMSSAARDVIDTVGKKAGDIGTSIWHGLGRAERAVRDFFTPKASNPAAKRNRYPSGRGGKR